MSRRDSLSWNVCANWAGHVVAMAIGFFLMPYVLHTLGQGAYGSWVYINSFAGYAALLYLGFGSTICRYVAKYHAERAPDRLNEVVSLILAIYAGMGAFAFLVACGLAAAAPYLSDWTGAGLTEARLVILLLGLNVAAGMLGSVFGGVLMGLRRFDLERGVGIWGDVIRVILIIAFLQKAWGLATIALIYLGITALESALFCYLAYQLLPDLQLRVRHLKREVFQECCAFSGWAAVHAVAAQIIYATDTIVIGAMLGTKAVVPFYIAQRLTQFIRQPIQQIGDVCLPAAGALAAQSDKHHLERLIVQAMGVSLLLVGGLTIGAGFFADRLIVEWMGPQFPETWALLMILLVSQLVALPLGILRQILFGLGHVKTPALIYLLEAAANLVLSIWWCGTYGLVGVALGTTVPLLICESCLLYPAAVRALGLSRWHLLVRVVRPQILPWSALVLYSVAASWAARDLTGWGVLIAITLGGGGVLVGTWFLQHHRLVSPHRPVAVG